MDFQLGTDHFIQWLLQSGYELSPNFAIEDLRVHGQGRGLIATRDIKADEILFKVPRNVLLNIDTGTLAQINDANKEKLLTKYDHWEGLILTILFELSLGEKSKWAPYFKILPENFQSLMYWNDEDIQALQPSLIISRIGKEKALDLYNKLVPNALIDLGIENLQVSLNHFYQVASTIMSYSFDVERPDFNEDEEDDEIVKSDGYFKSMIALADTLNSDTNLFNANLFYETDFLIMKSIKPIPRGEQIYNIYGEYSNSELLRRYGYVEWNSSKFDFGEIKLDNIKNSIMEHYQINPELLNSLLNLISQNEVDEIEEELVLDSYDIFIDGEIMPELTILIQVLTTLIQLNKSLNFELISLNELSKIIGRALKKCYQLIENGSITKQALLLFELIIQSRLSEYPSHAFRKFIKPLLLNDYFNKIKMSERVLKSEVESLQNCLKLLHGNTLFKIIDDDKLNRNILKRKINESDEKITKRQKI